MATITYQNVVLDANTAEAAQPVDAIPDDGLAVPAANLRIIEHVRRKVDPWLDGDDVPGRGRFQLRRCAHRSITAHLR